jgi:Big-like domain-containing protein
VLTTSGFPVSSAQAATTPSLVAQQSSPGTTASPSWTFTVDPSETTECRTVDSLGNPVNGVDWTPCTSPYQAALPSPGGDGDYTVEVRATDTNDGTTATATDDYVLDTTGPSAAFDVEPPAHGKSTLAAWSWSLSDTPQDLPNDGSECKLDGPTGGLSFDWTACTSPKAVTLPASPEGLYTLSVRGVDALGNRGAAIVSSYDYDITAPTPPGVSVVTPTPGTATTVKWSFVTEPNATTQCRLLDDGTQVLDWAGCSSPVIEDLTDLPSHLDGTYRLEVKATDQAGNTGSAGFADYVLDTTAPGTPSIDSSPGPVGKNPSPTWTFTVEAGSSGWCEITAPGDPGTWSTCTSPYSPALSDGEVTYTFHLKAKDAAGNISGSEVTDTYRLDQTAPPAPTVTPPTALPSQNPAPSFTFSLTGDAVSADCQVVDPANHAGSWQPCTSPFQPTLAGDGTYTINVRASDAAGNTAIGSAAYTLDRVGPAAPVFTTEPTGPASSTSVPWAWTAEALSTTQCQLISPTTTSPWAPCTSGAAVALTAGDGAYQLEVRATDQAGNPGAVATSATYVLDTTGPSVSLTPPSSPSNNKKPSFSWTTEAGATTQCALDTPTTAGTFAPCTSPFKPAVNLTVEGSYTFHVIASDSLGNPGTESTANYVLDLTAPATPTVTVSPTSPNNSNVATFSWSTEATATSKCQLTGPGLGSPPFTPCASPDVITLPTTDGTYVLAVAVTDQAGNPAPGNGSASYVLDQTGPSAPTNLTGPGTGPTVTGNATSGSFTWGIPLGETNAKSQCRLDTPSATGTWSTCTSPDTESFAAGDGTYTLNVRIVDAAGNPGAVAAWSYLLDTVKPAAPSVSGPSGTSNVHPITWSWTSDPTAVSSECRRVFNGTAGAWAACTSPRTGTLTSGDGTYQLDVRSYDAAGNVSDFASSPVYTLDTTGPTVVLTGPPATGKNPKPQWSWTTEAGATTQCKLDGPTGPGSFAPCVSPYVPAANLTPDGTYTLTVVGTDIYNNPGPPASTTYVLDTAAPNPPSFTSQPTSPGKNTSPSWSFNPPPAPTDATGLQCQLAYNGTALAPFAACTSPYSTTLGSGDGDYALSVRAIDAATNTSTAIVSHYVLDTTAPTAPAVTPVTGTTSNDRTPTWTITPVAADGVTKMSCTVRRGAAIVTSAATCTSPYSVDLSTQPEGTYSLDVTLSDSAGNVGGPFTTTYLLDLTAPASPIVSGPTGPSQQTGVTWTWTAEAGATTQCALVTNGVPGSFVPCTSPWPVTLPSVSGTYALQVEATDAAGNPSVDPGESPDYILDRTPPAAPVAGIAPGSPNSNRAPQWTFTTDPTASTTTCQLSSGTTVIATSTCTTSYTADLSGQPDGDYTVTIFSVDTAGNTGQPLVLDYVLDSTVPAAPTLTLAPVSPGKDATPVWAFFGDPGSTFTCSLSRGLSIVVAPRPCTSPFTADLSGLPDGTYIFAVSSKDQAGNASSASTSTYVLDTTAPARPRFTHRPASPGPQQRPAWSWTAEAGSTATCQLVRGSSTVIPLGGCMSPFTADLGGLGDGRYVFSVRATDAAGNTSAPATSVYVLDTTAPGAPHFISVPDSPGSDHTPTWAWTDVAGAHASCLVTSGGNVVRDWAACTSPHTVNLVGRPDATYRFRVRFTDAAGNTGAARGDFYVLDSSVSTPPPTSPGGNPPPPPNGNPPPPPPPPGTDGSGPKGTFHLPGITGPTGFPLGTDQGGGGHSALKHSSSASDDPVSRVLFNHIPSITEVPSILGQAAVKSLEKPQFPLLLLVVAGLFLLVQNRIDRRDPKLATAPVDVEPHLYFGPPVVGA